MTHFEKPHTGEFLLSEGNGQISRDEVVLAAREKDLDAGTLLIKDAGGKYVPYADPEPPQGGGTQVASDGVVVLYGPVYGSSEDLPVTVVSRMAEVAGDLLTGLTDMSAAALESASIIVR